MRAKTARERERRNGPFQSRSDVWNRCCHCFYHHNFRVRCRRNAAPAEELDFAQEAALNWVWSKTQRRCAKPPCLKLQHPQHELLRCWHAQVLRLR
jgi:hypothetical protein